MRFFIAGKAKGKGRPRFYKGHAVTPQDTRDYETMIAMLYKGLRGRMHQGAVEIDIKAYIYVPKSYSKKKRQEIARGKIKPECKPDVDNIAKIVLDGLNGIAYSDDKQVVKLTVEKIYTFSANQEGVLVIIRETEEINGN